MFHTVCFSILYLSTCRYYVVATDVGSGLGPHLYQFSAVWAFAKILFKTNNIYCLECYKNHYLATENISQSVSTMVGTSRHLIILAVIIQLTTYDVSVLTCFNIVLFMLTTHVFFPNQPEVMVTSICPSVFPFRHLHEMTASSKDMAYLDHQ